MLPYTDNISYSFNNFAKPIYFYSHVLLLGTQVEGQGSKKVVSKDDFNKQNGPETAKCWHKI